MASVSTCENNYRRAEFPSLPLVGLQFTVTELQHSNWVEIEGTTNYCNIVTYNRMIRIESEHDAKKSLSAAVTRCS